MGQDTSRTGSEDTSEAREHVREAAENRDALAREASRVQATAPDSVSRPVEETIAGRGTGGDAGRGATGGTDTMHASEDTSAAREHVREAAENRDALAEEARRVDATTPPDARREGR